jgi:hypothetical protein
MAEKIIICPSCKDHYYEIVKIHNPDTCDLNSKATLICKQCNIQWEGLVASSHYKQQREYGWTI